MLGLQCKNCEGHEHSVHNTLESLFFPCKFGSVFSFVGNFSNFSLLFIYLFVCLFVYLFNVYLFLRERETETERDREWTGAGGTERERERHRIQSKLQALRCQHRAWHGLEPSDGGIMTWAEVRCLTDLSLMKFNENENTNSKSYTHPYVYYSIIYNSEDMEAT